MNRQASSYQNLEGLSNYFTTTLHLRPGEMAEVQLALHPALGITVHESRRAVEVTPATGEVVGV